VRRKPIGGRPSRLPLIAVTAGEPAGIGPDLCVALARTRLPARVVLVADRNLMRSRARALHAKINFSDFEGSKTAAARSTLPVLHVPLVSAVVPGKVDPANSPYVLRSLEIAADGCREGLFDAMVTAPVHKGVINDAGIAFTGHTEYLASHTGAGQVVMMLVGGGLRVALVTTHLALKDVPSHITYSALEHAIRILQRDLIQRFGVPRPRIAVAGLNPHSGESGYLGREEIEIIAPVLDKLRAEGYALAGPLPADTLFTRTRLKLYDCALAMYHDQGLPVLKYVAFGGGVNVTLGLPIIRTSVDHGTALDLAGTGKAKAGSLVEAIKLAADLARRSGAPATAGTQEF
jgi:4-hydroxythreonine-4-phosphate dehydrogenase